MKRHRSSVTISASLRERIDTAREKSGRTVVGEVEAQLRLALADPACNDMFLLALDEGLAAHVRALSQVHFVGQAVEDLLIYMIRTQIIAYMATPFWLERIAPLLPEPMRSANLERLHSIAEKLKGQPDEA